MSAPDDPLARLAAELRAEETLVSSHVGETAESGAFGGFVAAGPRAAAAPADYGLLIEAIREGYLLHFGSPRIVRVDDPDLALLAGDYLYARGLERLAGLGDLEAVRELADLIALAAQLHAEEDDAAAERAAAALWLATATAVGCGPHERHEAAKEMLREGAPGAASALTAAARERAARSGLDDRLATLAHAVGFPAPESNQPVPTSSPRGGEEGS